MKIPVFKPPLSENPAAPKPLGEGSSALRTSHFTLRTSQSGVALVITLILLSVITFMAIAFLVISRGEKSSVTTMTDQNIANQGANAGLERFLAQVTAQMTVVTNEFNYDLMVPTNFVNPIGFIPGLVSPTNVNYDFKFGGTTNWNVNDWERNIANLMIDPRAPVFVTNRFRGGLDFRYYLDLNRNGFFEPTGWSVETNALGLPVLGTNGQPILHFVSGDPQWIGGLEFPDRYHGPDNLFTYRYTYFAVPVSKTLDLNYIYNFAKDPDAAMTTAGGDGFYRNQGVGTYEINLASFLVDLNTNLWTSPNAAVNPYRYYWDNINNSQQYRKPNTGVAFEDALSILAYRYAYSTGTLFSVNNLFGATGVRAFGNDSLDGYSAGPPMMGTTWPVVPDADQARINLGWSGSPNSNHVFSISDLFDKSKIHHTPVDGLATFPDRLAAAGTNISTYNRYTGYRLLSQLGTDSAPEPAGTINLNYDNLVAANAQGIVSVTNFIPWTNSVAFFTNAAQRLLTDAGYVVGPTVNGSSPTNILVANRAGKTSFQIQVYPTNLYNASVHRVLQLAANIYDATTNNAYKLYPNVNVGFPTVFRPIFRRDNFLRVFIVDYREVTDTSVASLLQGVAPPMIDLEKTNSTGIPPMGQPINPNLSLEPMVTGVPLVVGAKKGFPNFNEFEMQTMVTVTRKLQFVKRSPTGPVVQTNQMYLLSISNAFGIEAWNSYTNAYPRQLQMIVSGELTAFITNELGQLIGSNSLARPFSNFVQYGMAPFINNWPGLIRQNPTLAYTSFMVPFYPQTNNFFFLPLASAVNAPFPNQRTLIVPAQTNFDRGFNFPIHRWYLNLRTRLHFILVDTAANRIIDYVNLATKDDPVDITTALTQGGVNGGLSDNYRPDGFFGSMFLTNRSTNINVNINGLGVPTYGIRNQIAASMGSNMNNFVWQPAFPEAQDRGGAIQQFLTNFYHGTNLSFVAPYAPSRNLYLYTSWQANDPLVHYTVGDLTPLVITNRYNADLPIPNTIDNVAGMDPRTLVHVRTTAPTPINDRYEPWGYVGTHASSTSVTRLALKDPMVTSSDDWDFPTNKFPNVGWLGRVHRGTPWQTVYLKSPPIPLPDWATWSGNGKLATNFGQLSTSMVALYTNNPNVPWQAYTYADATLTSPTNDWRLLDIFSTSFNDNSGLGKLNINQTNLAAWSAILGGVIVLTNTPLAPGVPYTPMVIDPAGYYDLQNPNATIPPLVQIVNGINSTRGTLTNQSFVFKHLGDLMAVPQLTVASPYLNAPNAFTGSSPAPITDAAYERIPQQVLGLLKCDHTPRFVVYAYGQALKPAEHSYVSSGAFSGLYTNYQVTAETAIRAVVRIDGMDKNPVQPHAVVESYNVLPPD